MNGPEAPVREYRKAKACRFDTGTAVVRRRKGSAKRPVGQRKESFFRWNGEGGRK